MFATCRKSAEESGSEEAIDAPTEELPEIVENELDDDSEKIPTTISLSPKTAYKFVRKNNPYAQDYFRNPFDSAIYVSGTFCELRGNHFHAGLDIRTGGQEGWKVLAVADGYVERVKVSTKGYGRVIYIRHPNGYTSVYGHLQQFKGKLANYVKEAQYKQRKFEIELFPKAGELAYKQGEVIALSGNTGGSGGPHLHFEIRNRSGQSTNPLLHGLDVKDNLKPEIKHVAVYLRDRDEFIASGGYPYKIVSRSSEYLKAYKTINVKPGTYAFGMHYDDYFTDRRNKLGVNYCWLTANGKLLYQYQIQNFNFNQGRYIYTHTDPYLKYKTNRTYVRLFKERFNPLPYYKQAQNGEVVVKNGDSVQLKLFIQDYQGLTDSVTWIVTGDTAAAKLKISAIAANETVRVPKSGKTIQYKNWQMSISSKAVYQEFDFKLSDKIARKGNTAGVQLHHSYTPLHTYMQVRYTIQPNEKQYGDKLCAVSYSGKRRYYEGGIVSGNYLRFKTRSLGEYGITHDNTPPVIRPISVSKKFRFRVSDNLSGVDRIICSLDGKWILAEYEPKTSSLWGEIPNWIKPGKHEFKLIVIDAKGNRSEYKKTLTL
jgi:murein DD-endopeptidase MepM/ murein hydrolase activator NlpD